MAKTIERDLERLAQALEARGLDPGQLARIRNYLELRLEAFTSVAASVALNVSLSCSPTSALAASASTASVAIPVALQ